MCIYIYIYIHVYIYIYIYIYIVSYTIYYICIYIYRHTDTRMYIHVHVHVHIHILIYIYIYVYIYTYIYMYTYINMYMYMYIYIYIHIYIIIYESFLFARSPCRAAWVVPKIPEGSISNVIGREVWEEGEAPRVLIKQEQDPPTNVGEFSRSNQKPFPGHPPSARSAFEIIVVVVAMNRCNLANKVY